MSHPAASPRTVACPPARPILAYDGDCGFCRLWVERWSHATRGRIDYRPSAEVAAEFPEIPAAAFERAVQLIEPDGRVTEGAQAILRARRLGGAGAWLAGAYEAASWFAGSAEGLYRFVARNRPTLSRLTRLLWGARPDRPTFAIAAGVFVRLLGVLYAVAFASWWWQMDGLVGPRGIQPAGGWLALVAEHTGPDRYWHLPTLAWLGGTGWFLHLLCGAGVVAGALVAAGRWPRAALPVAWACYLSLLPLGREFLQFQWDSLLLEAGVAGMFLAGAAGRGAGPPSRAGLFLAKWLLFRLMFLSGVVKLASGDPAWRHLTALQHHFETQPLPTWIGWWAHHAPDRLLTAACAVMFAIELVLPFLIWAPRRLRHLAAAGFAVLQIGILLTGNYTFFNLLTLALTLLLVADADWPGWVRGRWSGRAAAPPPAAFTLTAAGAFAGFVAVLGALQLPAALRVDWNPPAPVVAVLRAVAPFHVANPYGLFAVMTTERREIILQGSADGRVWEDYEFRWKPGDPARRPGFVAPHQPRLDWQLWFAALGEASQNPWLIRLVGRLLEGEPAVTRLLAHNPFPDRPPRFVRAVIYDYRFTTPAERRASGHWWRRGLAEPYLRPVSLADFARPE